MLTTNKRETSEGLSLFFVSLYTENTNKAIGRRVRTVCSTLQERLGRSRHITTIDTLFLLPFARRSLTHFLAALVSQGLAFCSCCIVTAHQPLLQGQHIPFMLHRRKLYSNACDLSHTKRGTKISKSLFRFLFAF